MAIHHPLVRVALADLRPTQITVGLAEVAVKRAQWARMNRKEREHALADHWFPAVLGPGGRHYIVDHHHLGLALQEEGVETGWVMPLADLSTLKGELFWRLMEFHRWAHPYDDKGERRDYDAIPGRIAKMRNDPYRSLAGFVRNAGGYAKDATPFAEFIWADFFRPRIKPGALRLSDSLELPPGVVQKAVLLAHSPDARSLPGWTGVYTGAQEGALGLGAVTSSGA